MPVQNQKIFMLVQNKKYLCPYKIKNYLCVQIYIFFEYQNLNS